MSFTKQSASVSNCFGPLYTDYGMQKDLIEHIEQHEQIHHQKLKVLHWK